MTFAYRRTFRTSRACYASVFTLACSLFLLFLPALTRANTITSYIGTLATSESTFETTLTLSSPENVTLQTYGFGGGINGSVTDASGAAIPNASLQAVDDATGVTHSTLSSSAGEYSFVDLPLGAYTVTATATGFQTLKVDRIPVTAGSAAR